MEQPILRDHELETLRQVDHPAFKAHTIDITLAGRRGPGGHAGPPRRRLRRGLRRRPGRHQHPDPVRPQRRRPTAPRSRRCSAVAAVHHHLVREGTRLQAGLVLESGEPREVHHFATLIGYGASAINPYLMFESLGELVDEGRVAGVDDRRGGREERRQGARQGPAEDDLQDGDLDDPVLLRRADLRGRRPRPAASSTATSPAPRRGSAASTCRSSARRRSSATPRPIRAGPTATCCRSAASTPGAATASTTCGTRRRSRCCSTRSGPTRR